MAEEGCCVGGGGGSGGEGAGGGLLSEEEGRGLRGVGKEEGAWELGGEDGGRGGEKARGLAEKEGG